MGKNKYTFEIYEPGTKVFKPSGKKFKSGLLVNTVSGIVEHPYKTINGVGVKSYTFLEDDSVVECIMCRKFENE